MDLCSLWGGQAEAAAGQKVYGATSGSQYLNDDGKDAGSASGAAVVATSGKVNCTVGRMDLQPSAAATGSNFIVTGGDWFEIYGGYSSSEDVSANVVTLNGAELKVYNGRIYGGRTDGKGKT